MLQHHLTNPIILFSIIVSTHIQIVFSSIQSQAVEVRRRLGQFQAELGVVGLPQHHGVVHQVEVLVQTHRDWIDTCKSFCSQDEELSLPTEKNIL